MTAVTQNTRSSSLLLRCWFWFTPPIADVGLFLMKWPATRELVGPIVCRLGSDVCMVSTCGGRHDRGHTRVHKQSFWLKKSPILWKMAQNARPRSNSTAIRELLHKVRLHVRSDVRSEQIPLSAVCLIRRYLGVEELAKTGLTLRRSIIAKNGRWKKWSWMTTMMEKAVGVSSSSSRLALVCWRRPRL